MSSQNPSKQSQLNWKLKQLDEADTIEEVDFICSQIYTNHIALPPTDYAFAQSSDQLRRQIQLQSELMKLGHATTLLEVDQIISRIFKNHIDIQLQVHPETKKQQSHLHNQSLNNHPHIVHFKHKSMKCELLVKEDICLESAKIIYGRIACHGKEKYVEYYLLLETTTRGTLSTWYRYSNFQTLRETMIKDGFRKSDIPKLPRKKWTGNFSCKTIQNRVSGLNAFLHTAMNHPLLQFRIVVNKDIIVYKKSRNKDPRYNSKELLYME